MAKAREFSIYGNGKGEGGLFEEYHTFKETVDTAALEEGIIESLTIAGIKGKIRNYTINVTLT